MFTRCSKNKSTFCWLLLDQLPFAILMGWDCGSDIFSSLVVFQRVCSVDLSYVSWLKYFSTDLLSKSLILLLSSLVALFSAVLCWRLRVRCHFRRSLRFSFNKFFTSYGYDLLIKFFFNSGVLLHAAFCIDDVIWYAYSSISLLLEGALSSSALKM